MVVDDEEGMLEVCHDTLSKIPGVQIITERRGDLAADRIKKESIDLLVSDIRMPGLGGIELLRRAREMDPDLAAIIITAYPTVETAVECMKLGAADYVAKPFLPEDLLATAIRLLENKKLREENRLLKRQVNRDPFFGEMLGTSQQMNGVFDMIQRIAPTDVDVLILGETGTGKELVARSIHQLSTRKDKRFVPVDCGAIPEELMEREFFGHERGAFTGANSRSFGLLEYADKGTIFLDEIAQLPARLQSKLLRALQERRVRRVGAPQEISVDVRVVAATAVNLTEAIDQGQFRLDLYHRINVAQINLPALRERNGDIELLVRHFIETSAEKMRVNKPQMSDDAMEILKYYSWPGNVRELQNAIKRILALMNNDKINVEDLPPDIVASAGPLPSEDDKGFFRMRERRMEEFEKEYLSDLLSRFHGDVSNSAREALMPRGTLYRLLKKFKIDPNDFRRK